MKLTLKSKPKNLTLGQIWKLYLADTGTETAEFVIQTLDVCYPTKNRENTDLFVKMDKYRQAKLMYSVFASTVKGMVGNG